MSRKNRTYLFLSALICATACVLAPRASAAQEGSPANADATAVLERPLGSWVMRGHVAGDSLTAEVPASISNLVALRSRLASAADSLVHADETLVGTERSVRVRVIVAADGSIENAIVQQSSGNVGVDAAALRLVRTARFTAGRTGGVPIRSAVVLPLRFVFPDG